MRLTGEVKMAYTPLFNLPSFRILDRARARRLWSCMYLGERQERYGRGDEVPIKIFRRVTRACQRMTSRLQNYHPSISVNLNKIAELGALVG